MEESRSLNQGLNYVTIAKFRELGGVSRSKLYSLKSDGINLFVELDGRVLVDLEKYQDYINAQNKGGDDASN